MTRPYTTDEVVLNEVSRHTFASERDEILHALETLKQIIRKDIKDSLWQCPVHGEKVFQRDDCEECDEAKEVNVIINNILEIKSLAFYGNT